MPTTASLWAWICGRTCAGSKRPTTTPRVSPPSSTGTCCWCSTTSWAPTSIPAAFEHRAFYEPVTHRIEMHLVSNADHEVRMPGIGLVPFAAGRIDPDRDQLQARPASVAELFAAAGLRIETWRPDPDALFALVVGAAGMSTLSRAALATDLAETGFRGADQRLADAAPHRRRGRVHSGGVAHRPALSRSRREGVALHPSLSPPLRRQAGLAGGLYLQGNPLLHPPGGRNPDVRARRPARVQLAGLPLGHALLALLRAVVLPLRAAAAGEGIDLLAVGIDPLQPARSGHRC